MLRCTIATLALACSLMVLPCGALAQGPPDMEAIMTAQREAMKKLDYMNGVWRGPATASSPTGEQHHVTQTERVGPFLDGTLKVIEGRAYGDDGSVVFNALAIISYDTETQTYRMRSYTQGMSGDYTLIPTENGFKWEIPAGPMTINYEATIQGDTWTEVGDRVSPGSDPVRFIEMNLTRVGDSDWPAGGAVSLR